MTDPLERLAIALAECCNGGSWAVDYTEAQKDVWRRRAEAVRRHPDELDLVGVVG